MKEGRSLNDVATELARQRVAKRDFLVDTRNIHVAPPTKDRAEFIAQLKGARGTENFAMRPHAMRQVEEHLGIPAKFADRLADKHPELLAYNFNHLFANQSSTQLVRTLDSGMRAFLSSSYRMIDNYDFAEAVLEVAQKFPTKVVSCEVTEHRLYIKVIRTDMEEVIGYKEGWRQGEGHNLYNRIVPAAVFSNSEIGAGALWFRPAVYTKECTNLAVWEDDSFQKVHIGKKGSAGEEGFWEILSDKTKQLSDAALWSQVKDLTAASLGGKLFDKQIAQLKGATEDKIEGDVSGVVELAATKFQLTETERKGVLNHLIKGGELSRYGLHSAITRFSQDVQDYDRASDLERLGGRIIELPKKDWTELLKAA